MSDQEQFLDVIDRDEAECRFRAALSLHPLGVETIATADSLGRVLASNVVAQVDVPAFDRSNFDGYALQASDTYGASELTSRRLQLLRRLLKQAAAHQLRFNPDRRWLLPPVECFHVVPTRF